MGRKLDKEKIKTEFKERGCVLLEQNILNFRQSLRFICKCGYESKTRIDSFRKSKGCRRCVTDSQRINFEDVKKEFQKAGFKLISNTYKNANQRLEYICSNNHNGKICLSKLRKGQRCKKCADEKQKYTYEEIKNKFDEAGCKLLETKWISSKQPMRYVCNCGKESILDWNHFNIGIRCFECGIKKLSLAMTGSKNHMWKPDREKVAYLRKMGRFYRASLHRVLRYLNQDKYIGKIFDRMELELGYTWVEFKKHIIEHPNRKIFTTNKWHIDHIFPILAFVEYGITDIKIINALDNLQPLPYDKNISKCDKYNKNEFEKWLLKKGVK